MLIEKCTLEYPQKYGEKLVKDVKKWGDWVLEEARKELEEFYPADVEEKKTALGKTRTESISVGYIWARTIRCQNPSCEAEIPLMRQYWLAKKPGKQITLYPYVSGKQVKYKIVGTGYEPMPDGFDPEKGSVSKAIATCPVCGGVTEAKDVRKQFQQGRSGQRMIAVVLTRREESGKKYRIATEKDLEIYKRAEKRLVEKSAELENEWGINPVPDEIIPTPCHEVDRPPMYGMRTWGELFNNRQKLALITFTQKVKQAHKEMLRQKYEEEYAKAVTSYLGLNLDRIAAYCSLLGYWHVSREIVSPAMQRQALVMVFDYVENNTLTEFFSWDTNLDWILKVIPHCSRSSKNAIISQSSATSLPFQDNFFDAIFTDPPYYDNVAYSYLSDFFYVWLKRSMGDLHPDLFSTPATPKKEEIVAYKHDRPWEEAKAFFENLLGKSFKEIYRVLKPDGVAVIVYAHKTTEGWETVINALLDSGLVITASWPINTEMQSRLVARESAALASSIYIVARKIEKQGTGFYPEVRSQLVSYLNEKMQRLWNEGISGGDFFISAIGAGIEVFGKYEKIMDYEGNVIHADKLLEDIRSISTDYAVRQILHNGFASEISPLSRFYVLWRWNYKDARVPFDEARKLASSIGINLEKEWNKGFIVKEKEFIKVLGPRERSIDDLEKSGELIDVLHHVLLLWESGEKDALIKRLTKSYGNSEAFYRVAQAVSECLPIDSKEKKLLEGFLSGRERIKDEIKESKGQGKLDKWS